MNNLQKVKQNGFALRNIKEQTPAICLAAVKQNGYALEYVKKQTPEICLAAVQQSGLALSYVREKTYEICLEAVKENGFALQYVKEQIPEICLTAVKQGCFALKYVKEQTPEICLAAVQQDGITLQYVKEQTPEICITAIKQNVYTFSFVNIHFDISPISSLFDEEIKIDYIHNKFIKNLFIFKIDKPDLIEQYLKSTEYDIQLVKILQEYNYVFSKEQILESIQHKVEIPHIHQYGYNLNSSEFKQEFKQYDFYPESYNLDASLL